MTTEDDFQKLLDRDSKDHATRLVFADWLQERDDLRADGYRALVRLCVVPRYSPHFNAWTVESAGPPPKRNYPPRKGRVPTDWFIWTHLENAPGFSFRSLSRLCLLYWLSSPGKRYGRRRLEDRLAVAFCGLSPLRRAELLRVGAATNG